MTSSLETSVPPEKTTQSSDLHSPSLATEETLTPQTQKNHKNDKKKKKNIFFALKTKLSCGCVILFFFVLMIAFWKQTLIAVEIIANTRVTWAGVLIGQEFDIRIKKIETGVCFQESPEAGTLVGRENCKNIIIDEAGYLYKVVDRGGVSLVEGYRVKLFCKQEVVLGNFVVESVEQDDCRVRQVFIQD